MRDIMIRERNLKLILLILSVYLLCAFLACGKSEPVPTIINSPGTIPESIPPATPSVQTPNIVTGANTNQNQCPYIISLTPTNFEVPQNAPAGTMSSEVTCNAYDPDGDQIIYTWETNEGKVEGDGKNVTWLVPARPGNYTIKVTIGDGMNYTDTGSIINNVYSAQISGNTCYSKGSVKINPRAENNINNIPGLQNMPGLGQSTNPGADRFVTSYNYENTITTTYK